MKNKILENLNTKFLGKRIDYYESLESTHKLAKSMSDESISDGMVILADNQTAGVRNSWKKLDYRKRKKSDI